MFEFNKFLGTFIYLFDVFNYFGLICEIAFYTEG